MQPYACSGSPSCSLFPLRGIPNWPKARATPPVSVHACFQQISVRVLNVLIAQYPQTKCKGWSSLSRPPSPSVNSQNLLICQQLQSSDLQSRTFLEPGLCVDQSKHPGQNARLSLQYTFLSESTVMHLLERETYQYEKAYLGIKTRLCGSRNSVFL